MRTESLAIALRSFPACDSETAGSSITERAFVTARRKKNKRQSHSGQCSVRRKCCRFCKAKSLQSQRVQMDSALCRRLKQTRFVLKGSEKVRISRILCAENGHAFFERRRMVEQKPGSGIQNHDDLRGQHTIHGKHKGLPGFLFSTMICQNRNEEATRAVCSTSWEMAGTAAFFSPV